MYTIVIELQNITQKLKRYRDKYIFDYIFAVCHLLGDYLEGIKKDFEKASKVYKSTCDDYGYAKSCYKYGNYSFLGKGKSGSKGEPRVAYQYYEKGCNLNDSDACLHSGLLLVSRSMPKEIDRNVPKVSPLISTWLYLWSITIVSLTGPTVPHQEL